MNVGEPFGSGRVFFSCSTDAPNASCSVNTADPLSGSTLDFSLTSSGTLTVGITSAANSAVVPWRFVPDRMRSLPVLAGVACLVLICALQLTDLSPRRRWWQFTSAVLLVSVGLLLGCAGGSSAAPPSGGTPAGNYSIAVNAYTVSGSGTTPDATVRVSVTVN